MLRIVRGYSLFFHLQPTEFHHAKKQDISNTTCGQMPPLHPTNNSCLGEQPKASHITDCSLQRVSWGPHQQAPACWEAKQFGIELDLTKLPWPSACVFESAYRPQIQCIWEIHAGCFWGPPMENISIELSEPSVWPLSHMTPSCLPGWPLYFLLFPFASVKPVSHRPTTIQCLLYYACRALSYLGLLLSHFPQHPTEMPSSPHSSSFGPVLKAQFSPAS